MKYTRTEFIKSLAKGCNNFYGEDLSGLDLSGLNLSACNFTKADMNGTNLDDTDLTSADLGFADLRNATLRNANLINVRGYHMYLENADLTGAIIKNCSMNGSIFRGAILDDVTLENTRLNNAGITKEFAEEHGIEIITPDIEEEFAKLIKKYDLRIKDGKIIATLPNDTPNDEERSQRTGELLLIINRFSFFPEYINKYNSTTKETCSIEEFYNKYKDKEKVNIDLVEENVAVIDATSIEEKKIQTIKVLI